MARININFGGDLNNVSVSTLRDVFAPAVANLLGFNPANVEALVNGSLITDLDFEFDDGDTVTLRTKANSKAGRVSLNFGGDIQTVNVATVGDVLAPTTAGLLGFNPTNVEVLVNDALVTDKSFELEDGDSVVLRTKANSKAARTYKAKASPAKKASKASKAQAMKKSAFKKR